MMSIIGEAATAKVNIPEPSGYYYKTVVDQDGYIVSGRFGNYTLSALPDMWHCEGNNLGTSQGVGLKQIIIPQGVTSLRSAQFYCNSNLATVVMPTSLTQIGDSAFNGCLSLDIEALPAGLTRIGKGSFRWCPKLSLTELPSSVTSIGENAFERCSNLALTALPPSITQIDYQAFYYCSKLAITTVPTGVTTIGNAAFRYCSKITTMDLPETVTSISNYAFGNTGIKTLTLRSPTLVTFSTGMLPTATNILNIYVPAGLVSEYKAASGWSAYASKISAIA